MPGALRERTLVLAPTVLLLIAGGSQLALDYEDAGFRGPHAANAAFLVAVCVPLVARRRRPVATLTVVFVAITAWLAACYRGADQPPFEPFAAGIVAAYALGYHADRLQLRKGLVVFGVLMVGSAVVLEAVGKGVGGGVSVPVWWLVAIGIGRGLRERQALIDLLQERSHRLERDRERDIAAAASDERARIARELHDVIAHSVSLIVVQAGAERRLLGPGEERTADTLDAIATSGREALGELRRLLGVIRAPGAERLAPQPNLAALPDLLEESRRGGQAIRVEVEGDPVRLSPGLDLTAYRIVQEAITNARKHAPSASVDITLNWRHDELEIDVTDDGRAAAPHVNGTGHGLIGMRERAALFGGEVTSAPLATGGFRVHARLPIEREARA